MCVCVCVNLGIVLGAACTLSHMGAVLRQAVETLPSHQTKVFLAILEQLRWFAGQQIRNVAVSGPHWKSSVEQGANRVTGPTHWPTLGGLKILEYPEVP